MNERNRLTLRPTEDVNIRLRPTDYVNIRLRPTDYVNIRLCPTAEVNITGAEPWGSSRAVPVICRILLYCAVKLSTREKCHCRMCGLESVCLKILEFLLIV
jgi:hypothetical protein